MKVQALGMTWVKCTSFQAPERIRLDRHGIIGDRRFLLLDQRNQPVAPHHHGLFMPLSFDFDSDREIISLRYPDGICIEAALELSSELIDADFLGLRRIELREAIGPWERHLTEFSGRPTRLFHCERAGAGIDILPLTVLTTGALRELELRIGKAVDPRRFRANLIVETDSERAEEDGWAGRLLRVGEVVLRVAGPVPRCIVTHFNPASGDEDEMIVNALAKFRPRSSLPGGLAPDYSSPGFAAYAEVVGAGSVSVGDRVELVPDEMPRQM